MAKLEDYDAFVLRQMRSPFLWYEWGMNRQPVSYADYYNAGVALAQLFYLLHHCSEVGICIVAGTTMS